MKKIISLILLLFLFGCTNAMFKSECQDTENFLMSIGTSTQCVDKHTVGICKNNYYFEMTCPDGCADGSCGCDQTTFEPRCNDNGDLIFCEYGEIATDTCHKGCSNAACNDKCPEGKIYARNEDGKFRCIDDFSNVCNVPSFTSECISKNEVLRCDDDRKPSTEDCKFGCFEAECRTEYGPTDKENTPDSNKEEEIKEESKKDTDDTEKKDDPDNDEKCKSNSDCNGLICSNEECVECETSTDCAMDQICKNNVCIVGCEDNTDCDIGEACQSNKCVFLECKDDLDCDILEVCQKGKCTSVQCEDDLDCDFDSECNDGKCTKQPECNKDTKYCASTYKLVVCEEEKLKAMDCKYGCKDAECITEEEKAKLDKKELEEKECKKQYGKCITGTKIEFCLDGTVTTDFCKFGCKDDACLLESQEDECTWKNLWCFGKANDVIEMKEVVGGKYMNSLNKEIESEKDPAKLRGLKKYKELLDKTGSKLDTLKTTYEDLMTMKRLFLDEYDPSMDIENMDVEGILQKSLTEKIGATFDKLKFWKGKKSQAMIENDIADDQLKIYKAMLAQQEEIEFLKKSRKDRLIDTMISKAKDKAVEELKDAATDIAKGVAGKAFMTVGIAGEAIQSVQDESEKMMFTDLIKAYNVRRKIIEKENPDMDNDAIHKQVVNDLEDDPYIDDTRFTRIASYGKLVTGNGCDKSESTLCLDKKTFWVSMEKSYNHINKHRLFDRDMKQLDKKIAKSKKQS